jgi:hypothetical protein
LAFGAVKAGSTSFLKKRSKKLLHVKAAALPDKAGPNLQKFFGSFFQKRTCLLDCVACLGHQ